MDKYGYIGIETLLNYCENSKDHAVTPNEFMRMNRVRMADSHWIPCSDASTLPKDRAFWVTHMNGYEAWVGELYWDMTEWSDRISDVVAYMPCNIPEPYKENE